jgi:hypothetical protein
LGLALAAEEPHHQHAERKRAARKGHRLPARESLDVGDELTRIMPTQVAAEMLDLFGPAIGILCQHRLRAVLSKMLTRLAKRLGKSSDSLGDVFFAHVQSRRDLFRSLLHHRSTPVSAGTPGCGIATLIRAGQSTGCFLNLLDNLPSHVVRLIPYGRGRFAGLPS